MRIAVATNPNEMAFADDPKFFPCACDSELVCIFHGLGLSEPNSLISSYFTDQTSINGAKGLYLWLLLGTGL